MKKKINSIGSRIEDGLRRMCGEITPDKRIVVTLTMLLLLAGLSLYFTISSIYRFGKGEGERIRIGHIERLELELMQKQSELDSIKLINNNHYGYRESESERESE